MNVPAFYRKNQEYSSLIPLETILGHIGNWAIRQSPYTCPDNLKLVLVQFEQIAAPLFEEGFETFPMKTFSFHSLREFLETHLLSIDQVQAWNIPKIDTGAEIVFVSRYGGPPPDHDFIDLYALTRNIAGSVMDEARRNDESDRRIGRSIFWGELRHRLTQLWRKPPAPMFEMEQTTHEPR